MSEGRLTPFGEALYPLLERAGITPFELLVKAGRVEERNSGVTLLRHMYGPRPEVRGGYLRGFKEPLSLTEEEQNALSRAFLGDSINPWQEGVACTSG